MIYKHDGVRSFAFLEELFKAKFWAFVWVDAKFWAFALCRCCDCSIERYGLHLKGPRWSFCDSIQAGACWKSNILSPASPSFNINPNSLEWLVSLQPLWSGGNRGMHRFLNTWLLAKSHAQRPVTYGRKLASSMVFRRINAFTFLYFHSYSYDEISRTSSLSSLFQLVKSFHKFTR